MKSNNEPNADCKDRGEEKGRARLLFAFCAKDQVWRALMKESDIE